jgi:hypothetical protein
MSITATPAAMKVAIDKQASHIENPDAVFDASYADTPDMVINTRQIIILFILFLT